MNSKQYVDKLLAPRRSTMLGAVASLASREAEQYRESVLGELLRELESSSFSEGEKRARLLIVCQRIPILPSQWQSIIAALPALSSSFRIALASALPVDLRPLVYQQASAGLGSPTPSVPLASPSHPVRSTQSHDKGTQAEQGLGTGVLLLTANPNDATLHLLRAHGFDPVVVSSDLALCDALKATDDFCGYLIDGSFWKALDIHGRRSVLSEVASKSSFSWIRIDTTHLAIPEPEVAEIIRSAAAGSGRPGVDRLSLQASSVFVESQLGWLIAARDALVPPKEYTITPGELEQAEADLLQCALRATISPILNDGLPIKVSPVRASFFHGGRTKAKVACISCGASLSPIVAKVDSRDLILDEIRRFNCFIRPFDKALAPQAHIHGRHGVILFTLIADADKSDAPAPTLEQRLEQVWIHDLYRGGDPVANEGLLTGLSRAIQKLGILNRNANLKDSTCGSFANFAHPCLKFISDLEAKGRSWGLPNAFIDARSRAYARLAKLEGNAVVHGDMHVRNILLRDDRDAFLIDYASSGPGHPSIDLVRLDLSLLFTCFRPFSDEDTIARMQEDISVHGMPEDTLTAKYESLLRFPNNKLYVSAAVKARREALSVLYHHNGNLNDYLACKYIAAWVALQLSGQYAQMCRAVIAGLGGSIQ